MQTVKCESEVFHLDMHNESLHGDLTCLRFFYVQWWHQKRAWWWGG